MHESSTIEKLFRITEWRNSEDRQNAEKEVFEILRKYKVPLSEARCLFVGILHKIEDDNPTII